MNDTKEVEEKPVLLSELLKLVAKCETTYGQRRVFQCVKALVMGEVFAFGRHTITQLLMILGVVADDWSTWHRIFSEQRYDEEATSRVMVKERVGEVAAAEPF